MEVRRQTLSLLSCTLSVCILLSQCEQEVSRTLDLYNHLLNSSRYSPDIIPKCGNDSHVTVKIGMALRDIVEVVEKQQIIRVKVWVRLKWTDCLLQWEPRLFQNQAELVLPYSKIWIPDITLYEGVSDEDNMPGLRDYRASITSTGNVMYNFPTILTIVCKINVAYFPFDQQVCHLKLGSWIYSGKDIDLGKLSDKVDISSFLTHNEWDVVDTVAIRHNIYYSCCPDPYPDITFHIHMKRKPIFYVITIIFPCILINLLTFVGFVLPPYSGEKISLQITVLLSTTVFLLLVQDKLPSSSEHFPFLAVYFAVSMGLVCISCIFSGIVLFLYYRLPEEHQVPWLARYVFLDKLRVFLCVKGENAINDENCVKIKDIRCLQTGQSLPQQRCVEIHRGRKSRRETNMSFSENGEIPEYDEDSQTKKPLGHCVKGRVIDEWELFAQILDRLFMLIYLFLTIINSAVFFSVVGNYSGQDLPSE